MSVSETQLCEVAALISASRNIVALTGAGISTESGIPDFRGPNGVWTKDPAAEKLSTLQHYMTDPEVRRRAWQARLSHEAWRAEPNAGHAALVSLERSGRLQTLITQNIDGLHQRAGSSPARVIEIHGTILDVVCMACGDRGPMQPVLDRVRAGEEDPPCRECGGILKSATISFGQSLVAADLRRAEQAARRCDLLIAIGSSLAVFPIAGVVPVAKQSGARIVILNGTHTEMDPMADHVLHGKIGEILPRIVADTVCA
jgi:NAD-dependent deacetylase